jgi:phospholipid/cholesterol/gamma-HCH transport system ATP-binding protein
MNSVLEIGQHINFLYQGYKLWDGKVEDMFQSGSEELNEFLYATKLIRDMKS